MNEVENVGAEFVQSLGQQPPTPDLKDTEEEAATESQTDKGTIEKEDDENEESEEGQKKEKVPFHKQDRWKEREEDWSKRFDAQKKESDERYAALEKKIETRKEIKEELTQDDVPDWYGGDIEQYRKFYGQQTKMMEEKAKEIAEKIIDGRLAETKKESEKETKAVADATDWFKSEVKRIESDETLNPGGETIDQEALLKIAQENDLIDSKMRWNWSAAYRIYASRQKTEEKTETKEDKVAEQKKKIAAITTKKDTKTDTTPSTVKNADYFKKNKPW